MHLSVVATNLSSLQLVVLSEDGSLAVDCDVNYPGGFRLVIEIDVKIPLTSTTVAVIITATVVSLSGRVRHLICVFCLEIIS